MPRILQIVSGLKKNGTETFIMNLFRNIDREEIQFDFLVFSADKDGFYDEIISLGGHVHFLPPRRSGFITYHRQLDRFFRNHASEYDAVHLHGISFTSVAPLRYAKKHGISKRIVHIHGRDCQGFHNRLFHRLNKLRINNLVTHFLGCSQEALIWGYGRTGCLKKARVITNGINIPEYIFNPVIREKERQRLGLENAFVLGHVGSFNKIKNHRFLLQVFKAVREKNDKAMLICVGNGALYESIKTYADELNLSPYVMMPGHRDDIATLLQIMDVMVMPSLHEGFPLALLEAQAASLPAVVSTTVPHIIKMSPSMKFLSLTESTDTWAETILRFIGKERKPLTGNSKINDYSIAVTVKEMSGIYSGKTYVKT